MPDQPLPEKCLDSCACGWLPQFRLVARRYKVLAPSHLIGMVAGADEGPAGNLRESERAGDPAQLIEFVGRKIPRDRKVVGRGLEVLPQRQEVATDRPEVGQGFHEFLGGLAQAEHQSALGSRCRAGGLHVVEHLEADVILALAADVLLEPGDSLDVVIEELGAGGEDPIDAVDPAVEIRREDLDGRAGTMPHREDATAEMLGASIIEIVARDRGDHDVPEPESATRIGQSIWLVGRHGVGLSPLDRTEAARASTSLPEDHERGRPPRPALGAIRATCTLADGLETRFADQTLGEIVASRARNGPLQPCWQAPRSVFRLAIAFDVAGQHGQAGGVIQDWERRHAIKPCGGSKGGRYRRGAFRTRELVPGDGSSTRGPWAWEYSAGVEIPSRFVSSRPTRCRARRACRTGREKAPH